MKKTLVIVIAIVTTLLLSTAALAADVMPVFDVNMEDDLSDCMLHVSFTPEDVSETDIITSVYGEYLYDAVDLANLKVGDVITCDTEITVESIDNSNGGGYLINGGFLDYANGLTLFPRDGGMFVAIEWDDIPAYALLGQAQFFLADEVTFSHFEFTDDGGIAEDMTTVTVPAAELRDTLADYNENFSYIDTVITVEANKVTTITVEYTP